MKLIVVIALMMVGAGCGPDKTLIMESKFDQPLRQKMATLSTQEQPEVLSISGKCATTIDAFMRKALINAGADVQTLKGDVFIADVSSNDIFSVAALEFITQLQLIQ